MSNSSVIIALFSTWWLLTWWDVTPTVIHSTPYNQQTISQTELRAQEIKRKLAHKKKLEEIKAQQTLNNKHIYKYQLTEWFKDHLYQYLWSVTKDPDRNIYMINYSQTRDLEERDEIHVDKVYEKYIDRTCDTHRKELVTKSWYKYFEVTDRTQKNEHKEFIVIYLHWGWGNKEQGINNESFWWNFNRIQNLMLLNNWVYITVTQDFSVENLRNIEQLIRELKKKYPNTKLFLSWGSKWGETIWWLITSWRQTKDISWILLLWSVLDITDKSTTNLLKYQIPIYIWHWTKDHFDYKKMSHYYDYLKKKNKNYPIKIEFFQSGVHWTPIRMVNWKDNLNDLLVMWQINQK